LKSAMACEDTSISYRSKLYLKLIKHGLWTLVWFTSYDQMHNTQEFYLFICTTSTV
jgi:hypothetical protein